jgi:hypothetical protein
MRPQIAKATRMIHAPGAETYNIIADYRTMHPLILPKPYFLYLDVEEGGLGEGTIVNFGMRILGQTRSFRALITEPKPGQVLVETDLASGVATRFVVSPLQNGGRTQVTISTELQGRNLLESFLAKRMLEKIYAQELELLARAAEEHSALLPSSIAGTHSTAMK